MEYKWKSSYNESQPQRGKSPMYDIERPKFEEEGAATEVLGVIVSRARDGAFVRGLGRRSNALLSGHLIFEVFGCDSSELKFGDMVVVDIAARDGDPKKFYCTSARCPTPEELETGRSLNG